MSNFLYWWNFWYSDKTVGELNIIIASSMREGNFHKAQALCQVLALRDSRKEI
jgi:hypothetical protein